MSAPVDVLAVMNAACCVLAMDKIADPQKQLEKATAAVAELIEANKRYIAADNYRAGLIAAGETGPKLDAADERFWRESDRLRDALASCGGAQ